MTKRTPKNNEPPKKASETTPEKPVSENTAKATEKPATPPKSKVESETVPPRAGRLSRKKLITIISIVTAVVLIVVGAVVFVNVKAANELAAAKTAYETSLADLKVAVSNVDKADKTLTENSDTVAAHIEVANILAEQLGDGTDTLKAAIEAVADAQKAIDAKGPNVPKKWTGEVPENPTVEDYDNLREAVEKLIAEYEKYAKVVTTNADGLVKQDKSLLEAWTAQAATAPDTAAAIITATPNVPQETWDAVTAAGEAIVALADPLDATAPELWKALQDTSATATAAEKAIQDQRAAEAAEAARRAAANSGGNRGGNSGGNRGGSGGNNNGGGVTMAQAEAALAAELGISPSQVSCGFSGGGILCTYPGGTRWFGI